MASHGSLRVFLGSLLANTAIFARLQAELAQRRFPAPAYTTRQLRRIIYG